MPDSKSPPSGLPLLPLLAVLIYTWECFAVVELEAQLGTQSPAAASLPKQHQQIPEPAGDVPPGVTTPSSPSGLSDTLWYWDLSGSYINDFQTGGAVMNTDDRYTFGLNLQGALNNWDFEADYRSLTARYRYFDRIDELRLGARYLWGNFLDPQFWQLRPRRVSRRRVATEGRTARWYLGLGPQISYLGAGQLAGETLQNFAHKLIEVPEVFLPYRHANLQGLELGSDLYFSWLWPFGKATRQLEHSSLELGAVLSERLALGFALQSGTGGSGGARLSGYSQNFEIGALLRLSSNSHFIELKTLFRQFSYLENYRRSDSVTRLWADTQTAFWLNLSYRAGMYQRSWELSFGSAVNRSENVREGFGRGFWTFSLAALPRKKRFEEPDFATSLLLGLLNKATLDKLSFQKRLSERLLLGFNISMLRSIKRHDRLQYDGDINARINNGLYIFSVGIKPLFPLGNMDNGRGGGPSWGYLELYAEAGLGIYNLRNSQDFANSERQEGRQYFAAAAQIGLRWYGLPLRRDGVVYGLETALLAYAPAVPSADIEYFRRKDFPTESYSPRLIWFIGFCVITDL